MEESRALLFCHHTPTYEEQLVQNNAFYNVSDHRTYITHCHVLAHRKCISFYSFENSVPSEAITQVLVLF